MWSWRSVLVVYCGLAALIGAVGLVTPVPAVRDSGRVLCGSALVPDFSEARARVDRPKPAGEASGSGDVDDYTELCRKAVCDRRIWTVSVMMAGLTVVVATGFYSRPLRRADR